MLTGVGVPGASGRGGGTLPHVTEPVALHVNVKVLFAEPVFTTENCSLRPVLFAKRVCEICPSGVRLTPYDTIGTEKLPASLALVPVAVSVSIPVPAAPTL
jgi:hypothetical protein